MRAGYLAPLGAALLLGALFAWSGTRLSPVAPEERAALRRAADRVLLAEGKTAEREAWTERTAAYLGVVEGGAHPAARAEADTIEASGGFRELALAVERIAEASGGGIAAFTMERRGEEVRLLLVRTVAGEEER